MSEDTLEAIYPLPNFPSNSFGARKIYFSTIWYKNMRTGAEVDFRRRRDRPLCAPKGGSIFTPPLKFQEKYLKIAILA